METIDSPELGLAIEAAKDRFVEGLRRLGYRYCPSDELVYTRNIKTRHGSFVLLVHIPGDFPYKRPQVKAVGGELPPSWHLSPNGNLCLWPDDGSVSHLPWRNPESFHARVEEWFEQAGGPDPALPLLDLERSFPVPTTMRGRFVIDSDSLDFDSGRYFTVKGSVSQDVYEVGDYLKGQAVPRTQRKGKKGRKRPLGAAIEVGELTQPFFSWADLSALLDPDTSEEFSQNTKNGVLRILVVQYERNGSPGHIVLVVGTDTNNEPVIEGVLRVVPSSRAVRVMRGGDTLGALSEKRVAIVGVGAIGSHIADLLVRRGVHHLTLVDGDNMRPSNSIRHLLGGRQFELSRKVEGVQKLLDTYEFAQPLTLTANPSHISTVKEVQSLIESHDLIIDATASGELSTLLADSATEECPVVSVYLQRKGAVARVDRFPGIGHAPVIEGDSHEPTNPMFETGCVDPIFPATPDQVVEAAVWATRMAVDVLTSSNQYGPTIVAVNTPQQDPPYDRIGVVHRPTNEKHAQAS